MQIGVWPVHLQNTSQRYDRGQNRTRRGNRKLAIDVQSFSQRCICAFIDIRARDTVTAHARSAQTTRATAGCVETRRRRMTPTVSGLTLINICASDSVSGVAGGTSAAWNGWHFRTVSGCTIIRARCVITIHQGRTTACQIDTNNESEINLNQLPIQCAALHTVDTECAFVDIPTHITNQLIASRAVSARKFWC